MKTFTSLLATISLASAAAIPAAVPVQTWDLAARQVGTEYDELKNGACRDVTFIFARGSTETDNMGSVVGVPTCQALKSRLGDARVACQGVGTVDGYPASLGDNFLIQNTSPAAIAAAVTLVNLASTKCPSTQIVVGGYSQGTAVFDGALQSVSASVKSRVKAAVLFGFTRNQQDGGKIPGYPTAQTKVYCAAGDLVCDGTLVITAAHLTYGVDASDAASFLASKIA